MNKAGNIMPARRMLSFSHLLSSLKSSRNDGGRDERDRYSRMRHATADFTEADDDDESAGEGEGEGMDEDEDEDEDRRDNRRDSGTVLPLFSESHLDSLPVYSITHSIRIIVQTRTETTLTWDQLRSPQVSQFLVVSRLEAQAYRSLDPTLSRRLESLTTEYCRNPCKSKFANNISREPPSTRLWQIASNSRRRGN